MPSDSDLPTPPDPGPPGRFDFRLAAAILLLAAAVGFTWRTVEGLSSRRVLRAQLAEISHARYGLLNASRWVELIVPILDAKIDALDLNAANPSSLRPTVENALYRLLDDVKAKMAPKPSDNSAGGLFGQGNALMANLMIGALRPHVPEYAGMVLAELQRPENKEALKKYIRGVLAEGAKSTFSGVDMRWYSSILKQNGCADGARCQQVLAARIQEADTRITRDYLAVLAAGAAAFALLIIGRKVLGRPSIVVLMLFCIVLLVGGVVTPMIEVEAKITHLGMTFLGQPIAFDNQVLYFQSKSVLEVFHTLITMGRPDMWIVGVLVLMFSIVFPALKMVTLSLCLGWPVLLRRSRLARFFALESSKWSMADVMALAIFMSFVAFNGLIANTMTGLQSTGAQLVIPTDSSKILPGYALFIGFCLASLFLSKKLERGIRSAPEAAAQTAGRAIS
jgi:hypothetical protein